MDIKYFYVAVPFIFFIIGYIVPSCYLRRATVTCPSYVGLTLVDAAPLISSIPLDIRIIDKHERDDLVQGTILYQKPLAGQRIKPHQNMYLIISDKPVKKTMPDFRGKHKSDITKWASKNKIRFKLWYIFDAAKMQDTVLAHIPAFGEELVDNNLIIYVSKGCDNRVIMPDLRGIYFAQAVEACALYPTITVKPAIQAIKKNSCLIEGQKPLAGSIIDISVPITVYVY